MILNNNKIIIIDSFYSKFNKRTMIPLMISSSIPTAMTSFNIKWLMKINAGEIGHNQLMDNDG